jgi:hypothetical protein
MKGSKKGENSYKMVDGKAILQPSEQKIMYQKNRLKMVNFFKAVIK